MTLRDRILMLASLAMSLVALLLSRTPHGAATGPHRVGSYVTGGGGGSPGGSANEIQTNDGAGGFGGATNVKGGSGFVSIGATPASAGALRFANNVFALARNNADSGDYQMLGVDNSNILYVGDTSVPTSIVQASATVGAIVGGSYYFTAESSAFNVAVPVIGRASSSSPYGMHGEVGINAPAGGTITLSAAQYAMQIVAFGGLGGLGGTGGTVIFPQPATGAGYWKWVINGTTGNLVVQDGGAAQVTIATTKAAALYFINTGVGRLTPDT